MKKADCAATCGLSVLDDCGQCQPKHGKQRSFKDCNGDCFGRAYVNKCGVCVGGGIFLVCLLSGRNCSFRSFLDKSKVMY